MIKVNTSLNMEKCSLKAMWEKSLDKNNASTYYKYDVIGDCEISCEKSFIEFLFWIVLN